LAIDEYDTASEAHALVSQIRFHRATMADVGLRADRDNADPSDNFKLLADLGVSRLLVPAEYGGLWDGEMVAGWGALTRCVTEISAGDGPTAQNWSSTAMVAREVLAKDSGLPEEARTEVARRVLNEGLRLVASNAETGVSGRVVARPAEGGVILSGTKSFNTNSGGLGIANVGCLLEGTDDRHHVLVELTDPNVELHDDWDNMGQRGTRSQTVTYHDVFVPDGWHYPVHKTSQPTFLGAVMLLHAALMQGIGEGALEAAVQYARTLTRGILPQFTSAAEDPLILRRIGEASSRLAASRALLFAAADDIETVAGEALAAATVQCFRSKVASVEASLEVTSSVHEISGARSTSNKYRLDRFWRNARTLALHDPTDAKNIYIGMYEMSGELPALASVVRF